MLISDIHTQFWCFKFTRDIWVNKCWCI